MKKLILASQSPRRQELLSRFGYPFQVCPAIKPEQRNPLLSPQAQVMALAEEKAQEVLEQHPHAVILGADTLVAQGGELFGKPQDEKEALAMLSKLQGKSHSVFTGVSLLCNESKETFFQETQVRMRGLSAQEIQHYISLGDCYDKAGGYGIQSFASLFIEGITGDYFNVMGLPLCALGQVLPKFGIPVLGEGGVS